MTRGTALQYPDGLHIPTWTASLLHVPSILARFYTIHLRRHRLSFFLNIFPSFSLTAVGKKIYQSQCAGGWQQNFSFRLSATFPSSSTPQISDKGSIALTCRHCDFLNTCQSNNLYDATLILQGCTATCFCLGFFEHLRAPSIAPPRLFRTAGDDRVLTTVTRCVRQMFYDLHWPSLAPLHAKIILLYDVVSPS